MQMDTGTIGVLFLLFGFILIVIGLILRTSRTNQEEGITETKSKGIIFIGPIPIIWGFEKNTRNLIMAIGCILIVVWFLMSFF